MEMFKQPFRTEPYFLEKLNKQCLCNSNSEVKVVKTISLVYIDESSSNMEEVRCY